MSGLHYLSGVLLGRLFWTSIQATLLIAIVLLIVRLLPRLPARIRCMLWWLVSLQLVLGLCWHAPLPLPLLAPPTAATADAPMTRIAIPTAPFAIQAMPPGGRSAPVAGARPIGWRELLPMLWLAAMLAQLPLLARQWRRTRRLLDNAEPLADASLQALCMQRAQALGLRRCPPLYVCAEIDSPQVHGLRRAVVLLPARHAMSPAETAMAIAHELAHLRRGDLWLGWLPAIARRLFFFHPLAAWAMREYALEREAACDAEVLRQTGTMPQAYARLLLRLGVSHPIHAGLAGASPTFRNLKRRLIMLQHIDPVSRPHLRGWLLVALVAVAGVLPYRVTAASGKQAAAAAPPARAVDAAMPPMPPLPPLPPQATPAVPAPLPPLAPLPPAPPLPPPPPHQGSDFSARHVDIDTSDHAANGFALFDGDSVTINGSDADADAARRLHATNQPLLWFRRGDQAYIIRDKAMLERAGRIYAPVTALARQQGELAGDQGGVAGQQAGLAAQDAAFAQEQAALAQRQAELAARVAAHDAASSAGDAGQRELDAQQRQMEAAQAQLDRRHAELESRLATRRHALEQQQAGLEQQQQATGRRQQQAEQDAAQAMGRLLDEALAKGLAQKTSLR